MKYLVLVLLLNLSACATIFSNGDDAITFTSEPAGATVYLNGEPVGKTPLTYNLDRATFKQTEVVVKLDGYTGKTFLMGRTLATAAIFNLTCWPSWLTDATSGNMIEYSPRSYFIDLRKEKYSSAEVKRSYFVMINHKALLNDLSRGEGEFFKAYLDLSGLSEVKKEEFRLSILKDSVRYLSYTWPNDIYRDLETKLKAL